MVSPKGMLEAPWLVPIPILTDTPRQRMLARFATRHFCLGKDWYYWAADGELCVIPAAFLPDLVSLKDVYFTTDGKSYPRFARIFFSALGIGLVEGLAHDFPYRYRCQIKANGEIRRAGMTRKECDVELRQIGINVNDMPFDSAFAYRVLRQLGGFAWEQHRANDGTPANDVRLLLEEYIPRPNVSETPVKRPFAT